MPLISAENRAHWETLQTRRATQVLSSHDSALLLLRDQPAKRRFVSRKPAAAKAPAPLKLPIGCSKTVERSKLLGKRPREECDDLKRLHLEEDFRKRRKLHEDVLRKRRLEEVKNQEIDKLKKQQEESEQKVKGKREGDRAAARSALEKMEKQVRENRSFQDHYRTMKEFARLINYAPDQYNYFYP